MAIHLGGVEAERQTPSGPGGRAPVRPHPVGPVAGSRRQRSGDLRLGRRWLPSSGPPPRLCRRARGRWSRVRPGCCPSLRRTRRDAQPWHRRVVVGPARPPAPDGAGQHAPPMPIPTRRFGSRAAATTAGDPQGPAGDHAPPGTARLRRRRSAGASALRARGCRLPGVAEPWPSSTPSPAVGSTAAPPSARHSRSIAPSSPVLKRARATTSRPMREVLPADPEGEHRPPRLARGRGVAGAQARRRGRWPARAPHPRPASARPRTRPGAATGRLHGASLHVASAKSHAGGGRHRPTRVPTVH